jgi:hypothetical protein
MLRIPVFLGATLCRKVLSHVGGRHANPATQLIVLAVFFAVLKICVVEAAGELSFGFMSVLVQCTGMPLPLPNMNNKILNALRGILIVR